MRRGRFAGLVVALLVVGSATLAAAQPAVAATYPDAEAACGTTGDGQRLIGILPGSTSSGDLDAQVLQGNVSLYPGTTLNLALCGEDGLKHTRGSGWELQDPDGLEVTNRTDTTVTVRVTGDSPHIDVLGAVDGKESGRVSGVSITVPQSPTVDSELADATIAFEDESPRDRYEKNESAFLAAESDLQNATERLNESASAVESGDADPENVTDEHVHAVNRSVANLGDAADDFERAAYDTAFEAGGESTALDALATAQEREAAADRKAEAALQNYRGTLETAESDARSSALVNLVGALLVGLVVGAVPGWKLTSDRLERIRQDREVNSSVSYSPRVLAWAAGLAVLALVLALAALFALGGFGKLGGLL